MVNNDLRVFGLASGMDVDSIVQKLMKAESAPLTKLQQQKQQMEWQRDDYRDMNKLLSDLKDTAFNLSLSSSFVNYKVTTSDPSVATVTAGSGATQGNYSLSVNKIAKVSALASSQGISGGTTKIDPNKPLDSQTFAGGNDYGSFTITTYDDSGSTSQTFSISDPTTESLNDILKKVNDSNLGIHAYYDSGSDKVIMERTKTGKFNNSTTGSGLDIEISSTNTTSFLTTSLKMDTANEVSGQDASFDYNGISFTSHSNNYSLNGLNLNFTKTGSTTINVKNSTDAAFDKIKAFVDQYNDVIEKINGKISEKPNRDYLPLTEDQQKDMSDKEIELWTDKAKRGMLFNDSILSSGLTEMRTDLYTPVSGVSNPSYSMLSQIGISTSSNYLDNGKLVLNESKLKAALVDNPDAVKELFTKSNSDPTNKDTSTMGFATRLNTSIKKIISQIEKKAGNPSSVYDQYYLGRQEHDLDNRIDNFQDHLNDVEDRYYKQFSAMEQMMQQSNQQATYLTNALSG